MKQNHGVNGVTAGEQLLVDVFVSAGRDKPDEQATRFVRLLEYIRSLERGGGCICGGNPGEYEGPLRDCPVHGEQSA